MTIIEELDIKVIDVDTHVIEPYDLWTSRVSVKKYGDLVPHVRTDDNGVDTWYSGDSKLLPAAVLAAAGWKEAPGWGFPPNLDAVDPRVTAPGPRLELMDDYGTYAQVLYPNVTGFGCGRFQDLSDPELSLLLIQAYMGGSSR
jgi:hypothetical protein